MLWGTGGLAGATLQAFTDVQPLATASYRLLVGGALATLALLLMGRLRQVPRSGAALRRVLGAGVLLALFQAAYFMSISFTSVSLATLITIGSVPVFVTAATTVLERRAPGPALLGAVGCGVVGLALLVQSPGGSGSGTDTVLGAGFALAAGAGFSALTLLNRLPVPGLDPLGITALGCLAGGLMLLPAGLVTGMAFTPTPLSLGVLLYMGAAPTALAYLAYFGGLRKAPATAAALAAVLEPLTATLLSIALLGETLSPIGTVGACLLLGGVLLEYVRPRAG
ncbi:membrane protein [Nocardiopsis ansamitocini]|uniref:Membrane protein n=1 Tax=Nocardiopsis ansamitocini TaxID=1670832 RepID=A0A9W6P3I3_9ACTN|nr:membrane protein [Nocardiopsis ansamitocini]